MLFEDAVEITENAARAHGWGQLPRNYQVVLVFDGVYQVQQLEATIPGQLGCCFKAKIVIFRPAHRAQIASFKTRGFLLTWASNIGYVRLIDSGVLFIQALFGLIEDLLALFFAEITDARYLFCLPRVKDAQEVSQNALGDRNPANIGDRFRRFEAIDVATELESVKPAHQFCLFCCTRSLFDLRSETRLSSR